jgi:hypothetical protein
MSSVALVLGLLPAAALAQSALSDPSVPGSGYQVRVVAQAPGLRHDQCGDEATKLRDGLDMRISRSGVADNSQTMYGTFLQAAANAGAAGDNVTCAYWLNRYNNQH